MRALSVKQPWAYLISSGEKTIEVRSWQTDYRGKLLICSSKSERDAWVDFGDSKHLLPAGVMMCIVDLVDVIPIDQTHRQAAMLEHIEPGSYGWVLSNPQDVMLKPVNGKLRLFDVDDNLIELMPDDDEWFDHSDKLADPNRHMTDKSIWVRYD